MLAQSSKGQPTSGARLTLTVSLGSQPITPAMVDKSAASITALRRMAASKRHTLMSLVPQVIPCTGAQIRLHLVKVDSQ